MRAEASRGKQQTIMGTQTESQTKRRTQMVSLYFFPSTSTIFTLKSTPMVADTSSGCNHVSSVKRNKSDDFPVPESPMRRSLKVAETSLSAEEGKAIFDCFCLRTRLSELPVSSGERRLLPLTVLPRPTSPLAACVSPPADGKGEKITFKRDIL